MNSNNANWYFTPKEFADLIVNALEQTEHFKPNESAHPEDLCIAFVSMAEAIAIGATAAGKKIWKTKNAVMSGGNLKKNEWVSELI